MSTGEALVARLANLYAALASVSKSYDAEAVYEAINALKVDTRTPASTGEREELVAKAIREAAPTDCHREDWWLARARAAIDAIESLTRPGLKEALEEAREAIASLDEDALGNGNVPDRWTGAAMRYSLRDELLAKIDQALASVGG